MSTGVSAISSPRRARRRRVRSSGEPCLPEPPSSPPRTGGTIPWSSRATLGLSTEAVVLKVAIFALLSCLVRCQDFRIGLHDVVARCTGHAVFVRAVMDHGYVPSKVVMGRRRGGSPFKCGCFPWIIAGLRAILEAPEEIHEKDELTGDGDECRVGDEFLKRNQRLQIRDFSEL